VELLSRDSPGVVNSARPLLHQLASHDPNATVRRLAVIALRNGSPQRDTIVLLAGIVEDDEADRTLREAARKVAAALTKKARSR
jgi:hypothetical protein